MSARGVGLAAGLVLALAATASPVSASAEGEDHGWRVQLTPYVWMAGLSGDVRPLAGAPTVSTSRRS